MFTLELDAHEREVLVEILKASEKEKLHELHHADSSEFKRLLRQRLETIEGIASKLMTPVGG